MLEHTAALVSARRLHVTGALVVVAVALVLIASTPGSAGVTAFGDLTQLLLSAIAGACALRAARRASGRLRLSWTWIGVGVLSWSAGQLIWSYYELVAGGDAPVPSPADVGFLAFPVAVALGCWLFPTSQPPGIRLRNVLDGTAIASALLAVSWTTVLQTTLDVRSDEVAGVLLVALAYPIGDVLVVGMTIYALTRPGPYRRTQLLLAAAMLAMAVSDTPFAYQSAAGTYLTGSLTDLGWVVAFVLITVAAIRSADLPTTSDSPLPKGLDAPFLLPYLPLVIGVAVVIGVRIGTARQIGLVEICCLAVAVAAVVGRQYLTVVDGRRLLAEVSAREEQLRGQATRDLLTGLTNRALFNDRVGHALELHRRDMRPLAIMFCDLDDFKTVNDTFGHPTGDEVLIRVGERLRGALRTGDTLARFGGDEFAILIEDGGETTVIGARIIESMRPPFSIGGSLLTVRMSVGMIELGPDDPSPSLDSLLANADLAMYSAKRSGKATLAMYDPSMTAVDVLELPLRKPLAAAIRSGEITAAYQPVVSLADGMVRGLEALARWTHKGVEVPPTQFVPLALRAGLVGGLTSGMLQTACADLAVWSAQLGHRNLRVAVNVPPALITDPGFPGRIADVLSQHAINADQVILEITEEALLGDVATAKSVTRALTGLGIPLAMDDFGKGYSSLVHLQHIPLRILKIDMAFVAEIDRDARAERLIRALLRLGQDLGLDMVAEGVERTSQAEILRDLGCPFAQGHLFSVPVPADAAFTLIGRPLGADVKVT